jgi:hypothetical protein
MDIPIYGGRIEFYNDPIQFGEACHRFNMDEEIEEGILGQYVLCQLEDTTPVYLLGVFDHSLKTLVHELGHMCLDIIKHRGFSAHDGNGEPFCYLMDWLFDHFHKEVASSKPV